jgi:hypothetical protein
MSRWMLACGVLTSVFSVFSSGFGAEKETVMGNWAGMWYDDATYEGQLAAQVVAQGKGKYHAVLKAHTGEETPAKGVMEGAAKEDKVEFKGTIDVGPANGGACEIWGQIVGEKFTGRYSGPGRQGRFEMKKVVKASPTLGAKAPRDATVLFDGKDLSRWTTKDGKPNPWKVADGAMEIMPGAGDIMTKEEFGDFVLHLEFCIPLMEEARGQGRGNSGVFVPGNCEEIQILDSFGDELDNGSCGAIYAQKAPDVNASLPPGEWQTYDITCMVPRFDETGKMIRKTIITVKHNGVLIHNEFPAKRQTSRRHGEDFRRILLQDHGNAARFRNIWLMPMESEYRE